MSRVGSGHVTCSFSLFHAPEYPTRDLAGASYTQGLSQAGQATTFVQVYDTRKVPDRFRLFCGRRR